MQSFIVRKTYATVLVACLSIFAAGCGQQPAAQTLLPPTHAPTITQATSTTGSNPTSLATENQTTVAPTTSTTSSVPTNSPTTAPTEVSPSGDVPDNAVFVTYTSPSGAYSIQYVEGWTVTQQPNDGVSITDIDSSEVVTIISTPTGDLTNYITTTDEPQLKAQTQDYKRVDLKTIQVHNQPVVVLSYTSTSAPDPVTGKQRAVTSLRYYLPGANGKLAILTLTTPPDVDNVDAFNQILESFTWTP